MRSEPWGVEGRLSTPTFPLLRAGPKGIPATYLPSPNTGGGGPIILAGALALGNAECLVGLVLSQLVRPGTPFLYGMNTAALDMKEDNNFSQEID